MLEPVAAVERRATIQEPFGLGSAGPVIGLPRVPPRGSSRAKNQRAFFVPATGHHAILGLNRWVGVSRESALLTGARPPSRSGLLELTGVEEAANSGRWLIRTRCNERR